MKSSFIYSVGLILITFNFVMGQTSFIDKSTDLDIKPGIPADAHGSGVSVIDIDNDGDLDIYLGSERGSQDYVYINNEGEFQESALSIGLTDTYRTRSSLWLDYDGDHDLDLITIGDCDYDEFDCPDNHPIRLYRQDNGEFTNVTSTSGIMGYGASRNDQTAGGLAAADINLDGFIDFIHVVRNGKLHLFINKGDGTFEPSAAAYGLPEFEFKYYQPLLADLNDDGLADIFCNVDFGPNLFFINQEDLNFDEVGLTTGTNNDFNEMGIAISDYDFDGDFDLYATNIANFLGEQVHNILLENNLEQGDFTFTEISQSLAIDQGGWGWGTTFFDADNDGDDDLVATNGWDVPFEVIDQTKFWLNNGGTSFTDASSQSNLDDNLNATTIIAADLDRDGDQDLLQTTKGFTAPEVFLRILKNENETGNYIVIKPRMIGNNHFAVGAKVYVFSNEKRQLKIILSGQSFYGQQPHELHFGLGTGNKADSIWIEWPGGARSSFYDLDANAVYTVTDETVVHAPRFLDYQIEGRAIRLHWNDQNNNVSGFRIRKSTDPSFTTFEEINTESPYYQDRNIFDSDRYYYQVAAQNGTFLSNYSPSIEVNITISGLTKNEKQRPSFYPNPLTKNRLLYISRPFKHLSLHNIQGQLVYSFLAERKMILPLDLKELPPGLYHLTIDQHTSLLVIH